MSEFTYSEDTIMNVELIDDSPYSKYRKRFFNMIKTTFANLPCCELVFGIKKEGIGGFFGKEKYIPNITLPADCAECTETSIKFNSDDEFATFIHEASHFLHIVKDRGRFMAPTLKDCPPVEYEQGYGFIKAKVIDSEFEAGWRSIYYALIYGMFDSDDRTVLENNLINMSHYITFENEKDFKENEIETKVKEWVKTVKDFNDISDYKSKL